MLVLLSVAVAISVTGFLVAFATRSGRLSPSRAGLIWGTVAAIGAGVYGISENANVIELSIMVSLAGILVGGATLLFYRPSRR